MTRALLRKLGNLALAVLHWPVSAIAALMPKDPNLWVFGAWGGRAYADNSRWLFEHVRRQEPGIRAVWLTPDPDLGARLRQSGAEACHPYYWLGYWLCLRAGVAVVSNTRTGDLNRFAVGGRTLVVQLWHGTPIKKIGRDDRVFSHPRRTWTQRWQARLDRLSAWLFPAQRERFDLLTVASEFSTGSFMSAFGLQRSQMAITGLARTDVVLAQRDDRRGRPRRIAYLPTFRGTVGSSFDPLAGLDPSRAEAALAAMDAELWVKLHPANRGEPRWPFAGRVRRLEVEDLHESLATFDLLLTDFSSIFPDFLLLDRPVVFFVPDYELYLKHDRELYYDFDWISPGPKAHTWEQALSQAAELLADPAAWSAERARVCRLFHEHQDGRNRERIVAAIRDEQHHRLFE